MFEPVVVLLTVRLPVVVVAAQLTEKLVVAAQLTAMDETGEHTYKPAIHYLDGCRAPQRNRPEGAWVMRVRVLAVGVALCVACKAAEREVPQPPAKPAGGRVVDLIPLSLSGETWQDAEPFLALYASNPNLMAASAFTPNPGGSTSATAPIFVSDDGRRRARRAAGIRREGG